MSRNKVRQVYLCAFISGCAALVYEILWNRYLLLIFGSTTYSAAAVLAVFMAGLALGAGAVSRWEWRIANPLLWYGIVEAAVAIWALLLPFVLPYLDIAAAATVKGRSTLEIFTPPLLLGGAALLVPSAALGAGLPLLAMFFLRLRGEISRTAGALYGLNTLGATLGALAAGFALLPLLGMRGTLAVAVLMSLTAAGISIRLAFVHRVDAHPRGERPEGSQKALVSRRGLAIAVFLSSLAALGYQIVWTRILDLVIGSSTYSFSLTVAVFVLGTALGSFSLGKRIGRLRAPAEVYVHIQAGVGLLAVLSLYFYANLPELFLKLFGVAFVSHTPGLFLAQLTVVGLAILPPTFLIGAAFPVAVHLATGRSPRKAGHSFGMVFALTALGNVFGVLLGSLVLVPVLGLQQAILLLATLNLLSGLLILWLQPDYRFKRLTAVTALGGLLLLWFLKPVWDPIIMTSGVYAKAPTYRELAGSEGGLKRILGMYRMRYYKEGIQTVVSVVENPTLGRLPSLALAVDGKVDASTGKDMSTQVLSGHLPFAFHPKARDVLLIGLASGVTAGSVAAHPAERITVVEIEPTVGEAARYFQDFNNRVLDDPRLELIYDDGRHYLGVTGRKYDVIISEPSNPWMSGPARLFTREFFQLGRRRLRPEGVFAQWIPLYGLGRQHFRALIGTFLHVFPEAAAFRVAEGDLLLLGSGSPLKIRLGTFESAFADRGIQTDLARVGLKSPGALLSRWIGGKETLLAVAGEQKLNTDDNGLVEFGAPRFLNQPTLKGNWRLMEKGRRAAEFETIIRFDASAPSSERTLADAAEGAIADGDFILAGEISALLRKRQFLSVSHYIRGAILAAEGELHAARAEWRKVQRESPVFGGAMLRLAELELSLGMPPDVVAATLEQVPPSEAPGAFNLLRGIVALEKGNPKLALNALQSITGNNPERTLSILAFRYIASGRTGNMEAANRYQREILRQMTRLRRLAEREEGRNIIDRFISDFSPQKTKWLKAAERTTLEGWLRTRLLDPLSQYYRGVSLLWRGREKEASGVLRQAALSLPEPDPGSMIHYFLAVSLQKDDPATALRLLRAFAAARSSQWEKNGWLHREVKRLLAVLDSKE